MKKQKIMISQPMNGITKEQIIETRNKFLKFAEENKLKVVNTYFSDDYYSENIAKKHGIAHLPIFFLGKTIQKMSLCDMVYFAKGWENARGCKIEHEIASQYGLKIIYED